MTSRSHFLLVLVLLVVASAIAAGRGTASEAGTAGPRAPEVQEPLKTHECKKCGATGKLPCPEHPRNECEWETSVLFCSILADCSVCGGVGWVVCPECKAEAGVKEIELRKAQVAARRVGLKTLDDAMKRPLRKIETKHFVLVFELDRMKVDKRVLGPHELIHLYAKRLEDLYLDYLSRMMVTEKDIPEKVRVFVWWLARDQLEASARFCEQGSTGGIKLLGSNPSYSVCGNKQFFKDDEELHRNLVHSVTHELLSNMVPTAWIGNIKGGWADEGLSHWFEERYWGICTNYCYQEQNTNVDFKSGKYKLAVRQMVAAGTNPGVGDVFEQNIDTLTLPMHAVCMSYVDYFLSRDGAKFTALTKLLKKKVLTRDALKEVYGFGPIEFEQLWKAWVLQTYPTR